MIKLSLNRIIALAALALTLGIAAATTAQTQQQQPSDCATARVNLTSSNPKAGDEMTATVSIENCSTESERVIVKFSYTDSCGETTQMGKETLRLEPGQTQDKQITFLAPAAAACEGGFKVTGTILAGGKELTNASAPFSVRAQ